MKSGSDTKGEYNLPWKEQYRKGSTDIKPGGDLNIIRSHRGSPGRKPSGSPPFQSRNASFQEDQQTQSALLSVLRSQDALQALPFPPAREVAPDRQTAKNKLIKSLPDTLDQQYFLNYQKVEKEKILWKM